MDSTHRRSPGLPRPRATEPPPASLHDPAALLRELDSVPGLAVWRLLRYVLAWLDPGAGPSLAPQGIPADLLECISATAAEEPALAEVLSVLLAARARPAHVDTAELSAACCHVAEWCAGRDLLCTASCFAEAGAQLAPRSARCARLAATVARRMAEEARAAQWYQRAICLAITCRADEEYVRAQLGLGRLLHNRGAHQAARRHYGRAANRARISGRRGLSAEAHHDMMVLVAETGPYRLAEQHAARALYLYPISHPRIPFFTHDYAWVLLQHRFYRPASRLLSFLVPYFAPVQQVLVWGNAAHAAGAAKDRAAFETARTQVLALTELHDKWAANAWHAVANGAMSLGEWDSAAAAAERARTFAELKGETDAVARDFEIREMLRRREPPLAEALPPPKSQMIALVAGLEERLVRWHRYPASRRRAAARG